MTLTGVFIPLIHDLTVMFFTRIHCIFTMQMLFKGIAAGVQEDEDDDEIEWLKISEGENLTISIQINKSDEDPQVLVTRLKGSSQERIAQMICHKGDCEHECWRSGVSLISDGQNITLTVMNVHYNQTGLYKICNLSSRCNPLGSAPTHRAGREPGTPVREAGALPRRLKATASSISH